jgi:hypothetical protein
MTASLTPALALAYLQELSVDVRAAVVLDPTGRPLAGETDLAASAGELLSSSPAEGVACAGPLLVARTPDGGAIAVLTGSHAIVSVLEHDLAETAGVLSTAPKADG